MAPIKHLINENDSESITVSSQATSSTSSRTIGSQITSEFPDINRNELTRLMIQTLSDLGYDETSNALKVESGMQVDSPTINDFISFIRQGRFEDAEAKIDNLNLIEGTLPVKNKIKFLLRREKFLESLSLEPDTHGALKILRNEINELASINNIRSLTALLMNKESTALQKANGWINGSVEESRNFLLAEISKFINPNEMIPQHRLMKLLSQSLKYQRLQNLFQFADDDERVSLYQDIKSDKKNFPDTVLKTLEYHTDEVWFVTYSHDGTKLVTTSADNTIHMFDTTNDYSLIRKLVGHEKSVMYASFSPDDRKIVSCSIESKARVWDVETGVTDHVLSLENDHRIWCAEWSPNGEFIVLGSPDKELALFRADSGEILHKWEGPVVNDIAVSSTFKLITATYEKNIEVWDLETKTKIKTIEIGERISSVSVSKENPHHILINISPNELQLWDWSKRVLVNKYVGHRQEKYIIRSCFGFDEKLVASGSEDGRVFLWNRQFGALLGAFEAHKGANLNCVAWNPVDKVTFATCGDDNVVKVWGPSYRLGK